MDPNASAKQLALGWNLTKSHPSERARSTVTAASASGDHSSLYVWPHAPTGGRSATPNASAAATRSLPDIPSEFRLEVMVDISAEAARLRATAEAKPMRLPVNRKVDESHHHVTPDGLSIWFTIQVSPHSRIQEAIFERSDRMPSDEECRRWLELLFSGGEPAEAPSFPGSTTRRFEVFTNAS